MFEASQRLTNVSVHTASSIPPAPNGRTSEEASGITKLRGLSRHLGKEDTFPQAKFAQESSFLCHSVLLRI